MNEYHGKKFNREQLVFIVEAAIAAAFDRVEAGLPPNYTADERKKYLYLSGKTDPATFTPYESGALEGLGMFLGILYAQLTGDGLGIGDAIDHVPMGQSKSISQFIEDFVKESVKNNRTIEIGESCTPDVHDLAEAWVDDLFGEMKYIRVPKG